MISGLLDDVLPFLGEDPIQQSLHVGVIVPCPCHGVHGSDHGVSTVLDVLHGGSYAVNGDHFDIGMLNDPLHVETEGEANGAGLTAIVRHLLDDAAH